MTGIALLLLAIVLGVLLHKVSLLLPCCDFYCGKTAADDWRLLAPALGPEQTPLHQREAPAGGPAHAEEEPHGGLSAQQLRSSEETLFLLITS